MRLLLLLKTGRHYVCGGFEDGYETESLVGFDLVAGGTVIVSKADVEAVELYRDDEIERFRRRLAEIEGR